MSRLLPIAMAMALAASGAAWGAQAAPPGVKGWQDHVTLTLSERLRGEFADWFEPSQNNAPDGAHRYDFLASQLRFGTKITVPHVLFVFEGQDTQFVNLPNDASAPVSKAGNLGPGGLYFANTHDRDQGEFFLKQGNFTVRELPGAGGLSLTGGRFDYSDGLEVVPADPALAWLKRARVAERLVGPFSFTHVTRAFDGMRVAYDAADFNVTALGSRPTHGGFEVSANRQLDAWLAGLAFTLKRWPNAPPVDMRAFYLYYLDERDEALKVDNRPKDVRAADTRDIEVHTWGAHFVTVAEAGPGKVDGLLWGAVQAGEWGALDHTGWAYALETGYQFPKVPAAPWLRVGYNRSSGDQDADDDNHRTFFQILPTARSYAQFPFFNLMNNDDLFAQLILKPHERVTVRSDYHWLRLTESSDLWYSGGGATNDEFFGFAGLASAGRRELAHLVDLGVTVSILKQLTAYAYYGRAFGQGVVRTTFPGTAANYGYVEMTFRY